MLNKNRIAFLFLLSLLLIVNNKAFAVDNINMNKIDPVKADTYGRNKPMSVEYQQAKPEQNKDEVFLDNKIENENSKTINNDLAFELKEVELTGNTIFTNEQILKAFDGLIGKQVTFNDINQIVEKITKVYQGYGFITSKAYIPPQKITNGKIKITIMEGKFGDITINKTKWVRTSYLKKNILEEDKVIPGNVLNVNSLRQSVAKINNTEYLKGKISIKKGEASGTTDVLFDVKDRIPIDLNVNCDNFGKDYTGLSRSSIILADNNLSGFGDRLSTSVLFSKGVFGTNNEYAIPIGHKGALLKTRYSFNNMEIGKSLRSQKIGGRTHSVRTSYEFPIYRTFNWDVNGDIAFEALSSTMRSKLTSAYDNNYEYRALSSSLSAVKYDQGGSWMSRFIVTTGIPLFGATTTKEDSSDADCKFVNLKLEGSRYQKLPANSNLIVRFNGQYSPTHLMSPEQHQLGGMYSVRGFEEGVLYGDIGYNLTLEARTPVPYLPEKIKIGNKYIPLKNRIYFATFYDQGLTKELSQNVHGISYQNFLQSIGAGLNFYITKYLNANCYIGVPLGRKRFDDQNSVRFHFGIASDLI